MSASIAGQGAGWLGQGQHSWRAFWMILALAALARLAVWATVTQADPARFLRPDSAGYLDSAAALVQLGRFAVAPNQPENPQRFRTPGYPFYLAALQQLTGRTDPATLALSQIGLSLTSLALVYWLGLSLWNGRVAALAALIFGFDIPAFAHTFLLISETLFTLLLLLLVAALVRLLGAEARSTGRWAVGVGLLLGLLALVRPVGYYLAGPLAIALGWIGWRRGWPARGLALLLLALLIPYGLLVGGWQWRNYRLTGDPAFSTVMTNNLYFYRAAGVVALRDGISLAAAQEQLRAKLPPLTGKALDGWLEQQAITILRAEPWLAVRSAMIGGTTMLLGLGDGVLTGLLTEEPAAGSAAWAFLRGAPANEWQPIALLAFGLAGLLLLIQYGGCLLWWVKIVWGRLPWSPIHLLCWLILAYFVLISAGPEANSRLRVPLTPLLALYAAAGFAASKPGRGAAFSKMPASRQELAAHSAMMDHRPHAYFNGADQL
jgi:4-amino-4-deoxy-L-arabinose transferase-like glycosyltransferase